MFKKTMHSLLTEMLIIFCLALVCFLILVRYLETIGVFFPSTHMSSNPSVIGLPWEDVYFKTADGKTLNGWFFKHARARTTLLFAHGNAGNISDRLFKVKFFYNLGMDVFIFDYRGYGKSEGRPNEKGVYEDARAAYDYLQSRKELGGQKFIFYGASLGGAVVVDLATHYPPALLVVESSFTNAADMAHIHYPFVPAFFLNLKFDSLNKVKRLRVPKLFIHSPEDEVVPYWVGEKLFREAAEPKEFLKIHGGHNDGSITAEPAAAGEFIRILKSKELI